MPKLSGLVSTLMAALLISVFASTKERLTSSETVSLAFGPPTRIKYGTANTPKEYSVPIFWSETAFAAASWNAGPTKLWERHYVKGLFSAGSGEDV